MKTHLRRVLRRRLLAAIMSTAFLLPACALLLSTRMMARSGIAFGKSEKNDVSLPLRSQPRVLPRVASIQVKRGPLPTLPTPQARPDTVVQSALVAPSKMPATGANWEGINFAASGNTPPDINGAAGPNHYIQIVNVHLQVWDKKGASLLGPIPIASLWFGFGGACELYGSGDPIVLYDRLADRWLVSQIGGAPLLGQPFHQCIAVSATPDPLGAWNRYAFQMPGDDFIDYPKFGVWPDGYYMTENEYNNSATSYLGARAWAFDRAAMIAGQPAAFQMSPLIAGAYTGTMMPADLDGRTPPPVGAPNYILAFSSPFFLWQFHIDWQNPLNSTFTNTALLTAGFTASPTCMNPGCVPEKSPSPANLLSAIGDRFMFRLAYRNFGDHESLVVSHVVHSNTSLGMRWYEIRSPGVLPSSFSRALLRLTSTIAGWEVSPWMETAISRWGIASQAILCTPPSDTRGGWPPTRRENSPRERRPSSKESDIRTPPLAIPRAGATTAACRSIRPMTAHFGIRRNTTAATKAETGRHALHPSASPDAAVPICPRSSVSHRRPTATAGRHEHNQRDGCG